MIFVDESAANERASNRKFGWAPKGLPLMNIDYSSVLNVGLYFRHILWMVSLLGKFFKVLSQWSYLRNLSSLRSFHDATLIQLNALLLSWITLLYISQRYVPMLKKLLITSTSKIFALNKVFSQCRIFCN